MASASSVAKQCFNSNCKIGLEQPRKGWRRRTGDYADLCDRCASAYEEGKFCESFHLNASGWRSCESCGKQIHCGCIVSFHMFVLLDAGGIECINCTRRSFILTPNPAWPPPSLILPGLPDSIKDLSVKNWSSIASSGPVPWRQAPSLFHSEMHPKTPFEVDKPSGFDRLLASERLCASSLDMNKKVDFSERLMNRNLKTGGASQIFENGTSGSKFEEQPNPYVNAQKLTLLKNEPFTPHFSLTVNPTSKSQTSEQTKASGTLTQPMPPPAAAGKQFCSPPNRFDSSSEAQTRNGRPQGPNQLLHRYWPRTTHEELQQISGASNTVMTPLFEKMLSASDAGKIGRLVLPKKCAETYFPPISNPEGMPLMVQDLKGTEWAFHFRFWPNNNSRMYVLEGVTPCIQSLQLQAGDRVTFSRLEPEGKLVIGGRKAYYAPPSNQSKGLNNIGNGASVSSSLLGMKQANSANPTTWLEVDKPVFRSKRKSNKRIRIESEEMIELKLNWEQAQGLFRPPPNNVPRIVVIEGYEFEEFEEPPIIGRPTILATDHVGKMIQWVQCEDCLKWRKVPGDILFPSRWTCSGNLWDPERSICSVAQELTAEELEDLVPTGNQAGAKKIKANNEETNPLEALEGLDALADLAIQDEGDAQATTTKHPRHKPGCSCIVCIQPPSGRGPKHKHTCTCNVCLTVKRRFRTLMLNREKKQSGKEAETALQMTNEEDIQILLRSDTGGNASPSHTKMVKGQIDLNIQPEREEESSPVSDSGSIMKFLQDATERYLKQQKLSARSPMHHSNGVGVGNLSNVIIPPLDGGHQNATNSDYPPNLTSN